MQRIAWLKSSRLSICIVLGVIAAGVTARLVYLYRSRTRPVVLSGAIVRKDADPWKQAPIAKVKITVAGGTADESTESDASGLFKLAVHPFLLARNRPINLRFEHADFQPFDLAAHAGDRLYVVRMAPLARKEITEPDHVEKATKPARIANLRIRYSIKNQKTINVGSLVRQFEAVNTGNLPCKGQRPCSPDGKWKASTGKLVLDADKGNEFRNVRVSCIAGPCPFTRLEPTDLSKPVRKLDITAYNWSDTAGFLVEAEVTRTMTTDTVRQSYPFTIGQTMSFALPVDAEGPSIIADVNGHEIVFPLGPKLILSWAACSMEVAQGGNKLYRCQAKPGYLVQP